MPRVTINDVGIYYEVTGQGFPLVLCHEFAGDYQSWHTQVRYFSRRYQVITYNARGYPPSDVPTQLEAYSQEQAVEDLHGLLLHLRIDQAYVAGLSMGGSVALNFGFSHPEVAKALVVAGTGTGSANPEEFRREVAALADRFESEGMEVMAEEYARGRTRLPFLRKDPRGWEEFKTMLADHSPLGSALTFRGVQGKRPSVFDQQTQLRGLTVPTLILCGDEDEPCIDASVFMKRNIPSAGLMMLPQTGHTLNLEEPDLFNRAVMDFLTAVEEGTWAQRDVKSETGYLLR
ncbi:MAG: alpha/beta hydrolase [Chloroflexi bacterium]|nr:alpha/beta hydrolase [Chloroflexota bacterium]